MSDEDNMSDSDPDISASAQFNAVVTGTSLETKLYVLSLFGCRDSDRLFYSCLDKNFSGEIWCFLHLNKDVFLHLNKDVPVDWEDIARNYHDYMGRDFWEEVIAFLGAAEPAFKARQSHFCSEAEPFTVNTPKPSHVKRLKELLMKLEPRHKCYSVSKLTWLIKKRSVKPRYNMRAVIEYQDKFGKDAALHTLETHADIMFGYSHE